VATAASRVAALARTQQSGILQRVLTRSLASSNGSIGVSSLKINAVHECADRLYRGAGGVAHSCRMGRRIVVGVELLTGSAAVVGGLLLTINPDGSLLHAEQSSLRGSPFEDWRVPGVLLAALVGGGFLLAGVCSLLAWRHAGALSIFAGFGLVVFEVVEMVWLGFQPLELVFCGVGIALAILSMRRPTRLF
jgi:hypothetical protein